MLIVIISSKLILRKLIWHKAGYGRLSPEMIHIDIGLNTSQISLNTLK